MQCDSSGGCDLRKNSPKTMNASEEGPSEFDLSPNKTSGYRMVVMEMSLAILGILFNLIVLISIREKESLLNLTSNVILANLCFANLVSSEVSHNTEVIAVTAVIHVCADANMIELSLITSESK